MAAALRSFRSWPNFLRLGWTPANARPCLRLLTPTGSAMRRSRLKSGIITPATAKPWTAPAQPCRDDRLMNIDRPFTTKTDWVYHRLRGEILEGSLKPDDRLRLSSLAQRFQTSEMPVREALRMLQRDGLISFANHRGATVVKLSMERAAEIVSVRM